MLRIVFEESRYVVQALSSEDILGLERVLERVIVEKTVGTQFEVAARMVGD